MIFLLDTGKPGKHYTRSHEIKDPLRTGRKKDLHRTDHPVQHQGLTVLEVHWVTEITYVNEPDFFVDEQRTSPYAAWTHQHHFREIPEGVEMTDTIRYAIPLGIIGRLANRLFVERALNAIFDFRFITLENHFKRTNLTVQKL